MGCLEAYVEVYLSVSASFVRLLFAAAAAASARRQLLLGVSVLLLRCRERLPRLCSHLQGQCLSVGFFITQVRDIK